MEKNSVWDNNIVLFMVSGLVTVLIVFLSMLLAIPVAKYIHLLSESNWTKILSGLFSAISTLILKRLKERHCLNITFLINEVGKNLEEREAELDNSSFLGRGICKVNCEVILTGRTKKRTLLIQLEEGVEINFNTSNPPISKMVNFANILTQNNGEKGVEFKIPSSSKWDRNAKYSFYLYLEQDSDSIDYEKAYKVTLKNEKWYEQIMVNLRFNSLTFKVRDQL